MSGSASLSDLLEITRAVAKLNRSKEELRIALALCQMEDLFGKEAMGPVLEEVGTKLEYSSLTPENLMARARTIAGLAEPLVIDFENKTIHMASFGNDSGTEELGNATAKKWFFQRATEWGLTSQDKIQSRMERLRTSPLHVMGEIPLYMLLKEDVEGEKAGHPLCHGCMIHHEDGKHVGRKEMH